MTVGHLGFQVYPLLAVVLVVLFSPLLPEFLSAIYLALIFALMVNEAGFNPIIICLFVLMLTLPILYLVFPNRFHFKRLARVAVLGCLLTVLLTGSKIFAVYSFMRFFPRTISDSYATSPIAGLFGILLQLLGPMTLAPLLKLAGVDPNLLPNYMLSATRAMYGYWEFDMSMPPVALGIIFIGVYGVLRNIQKNTKLFLPNKKWIAWILLLASTWLVVEFILAKGLFYPFLEKLPVLSSLHVNPRFTAAFLFPLALSAAIIYNRWAARWQGRKPVYMFLALDALTLIPLCTYYLIGTGFQYRIYDITTSQAIYNSIRSGDTLATTEIVSDVDNTDALLLHESNLEPYEAIFGYGLEDFHPEIHAGSIWDTSDGYFNMTNPSGYVFPEINGSRPFERIAVSDQARLEALANHRQPDWKIPLCQRILDWVSGSAFVIIMFILALLAIRQLRLFARRRKS